MEMELKVGEKPIASNFAPLWPSPVNARHSWEQGPRERIEKTPAEREQVIKAKTKRRTRWWNVHRVARFLAKGDDDNVHRDGKYFRPAAGGWRKKLATIGAGEWLRGLRRRGSR